MVSEAMSGWLLQVPAEEDAGTVTIANLYAAWVESRSDALNMVATLLPVGAHIKPQILSSLSGSLLRGLKLEPGEAALLCREF